MYHRKIILRYVRSIIRRINKRRNIVYYVLEEKYEFLVIVDTLSFVKKKSYERRSEFILNSNRDEFFFSKIRKIQKILYLKYVCCTIFSSTNFRSSQIILQFIRQVTRIYVQSVNKTQFAHRILRYSRVV